MALSSRFQTWLPALTLLICSSLSPLSAAIFHVAPPPLGNDANSGTVTQPWATLQHAAEVVGPGDEVVVQPGTYVGMHLTTSGSASDPIVFRAAGPGVIVDTDNSTTPDGLNLEGASWVEVEGFEVTGITRAGIRAVLCDHVTLRGNTLTNNGRWGIFTGFCDDLLIEGNQSSGAVIEHGIYVSNSGDRPVIRGNRIWNNNANGIHMNGDVSQGGDGIISDALVEQNRIWDNGLAGGSGINMDGVQDSLIRNNLIFDTHASGISLYQIDGGGPSTGNRVFGNTVIVADDGRWALNIRDGATGNAVRDNILYSHHSFGGALSVSVDSLPLDSDFNAMEDRVTTDDGNSTLTLAQWQSASGQDLQSLASDPSALFVDAANDDYALSSLSPALDAGVDLLDLPSDLVGTGRPQGLGTDMGAIEDTGGAIFSDGFESGDFSSWSTTTP
jgi:hypothetical protein